jgi:Flp pilus assembly pilin Flp
MASQCLDCLRDERAQGVTEYGVLIGVFALGVMGALLATGDRCRLFLELMNHRLGRVGS